VATIPLKAALAAEAEVTKRTQATTKREAASAVVAAADRSSMRVVAPV
jgi:hypothetical protein